MVKALFIKYIFDSEEADPKARFAVLQREEQLPFTPVPGHEVFWGRERAQKVTGVTWNVEGAYFSCRVADEFPDNVSLDGLDFDELLESATQSDWTLVKVYE